MPSRRFVVWFLVVLAVSVFANLPRDGGALKSFLVWAGFPWTFAFWNGGKLESFSLLALAGDIAIALGCATTIAYLCDLSRPRPDLHANTANEAT